MHADPRRCNRSRLIPCCRYIQQKRSLWYEPMPPANRLASETSPYLRQHAHNPVDWYPWGAEALARAQAEQKPIFLSVGYAACHWCHVMERESFEDPAVAAILNEHFINIKVDREERPDVDQIYMSAVVALTRHGGWPMSVFLTPEQQPFYAGTYFPPEDRHGMPSFRRVLQGVLAAWKERRAEVTQSAEQITAHLREAAAIEAGDAALTPDLLRQAESLLARAFDARHGGFGQAPKFPHPLEIRLLLRLHRRFHHAAAKDMALLSLDKMAAGGIYDHLGGGFHRYSTDSRWLVPHFEKMLYDNALLVQAYLDGWLAEGRPRYREVVEETLAWVEREMIGPDGCFFSTLDADSEGEEGKFYVWSAEEVERVLGKERADRFAAAYDVTTEGNWEGKNILHRPKSDEQDAQLLGVPVEALCAELRQARHELLAARGQRVRPGLDDKYLTAWNGLMVSAFAQAAQVLDPKYATPARRAMDAVLSRLRHPSGRLLRTASPSQPGKLLGYLEDYSFLLVSLVDLYETTFEERWLRTAAELADQMIDLFWDKGEGGFFFVGRDGEALLHPSKDPQDNAVPSGNSMAVVALLRLATLMDRGDWRTKAEQTLRLFSGLMASMPMAFGQMLAALDFHLGPVRTYALVGPPGATEVQDMLRAIRERFEPNRVVIAGPEAGYDTATARLLPALAGKRSIGSAAVYLCEGSTCEPPLPDAAALRARLAQG